MLGEGEFGIVVRATLRTHANTRDVAVKMLKGGVGGAEARALVREGMRLRDLHHAHIVQLVGVCMQGSPMLLVFEFMERGDLKSLLRRLHTINTDLSRDVAVDVVGEPHLVKLSVDVTLGLVYLHEHRYVHRDIAARYGLID